MCHAKRCLAFWACLVSGDVSPFISLESSYMVALQFLYIDRCAGGCLSDAGFPRFEKSLLGRLLH